MWPFNFLPCFRTSSTCFLLPFMLPCSYQQPSQTCRKMDFLTYKLLGFGDFPSSLRGRGKASSELPILLFQVSKAGNAQGFTARPPIPCQVRGTREKKYSLEFFTSFLHHTLVSKIFTSYHTWTSPVWRQRDCVQCAASLWIRRCCDTVPPSSYFQSWLQTPPISQLIEISANCFFPWGWGGTTS